MQLALDVARPEVEEAPQDREFRRNVQMLPDEALQEGWVVGQMIEDLRRRHPVALQLQPQITHRRFTPLVATETVNECQCYRVTTQEKINDVIGLAAWHRECCQPLKRWRRISRSRSSSWLVSPSAAAMSQAIT